MILLYRTALLNLLTISAVLAFLISTHPVSAEESPSVAFRLGEVQLLATEPSYLDLGAGAFGFSDEAVSPAASVEYRYGKKLFFMGPALGIMANTEGGIFGYGGIYADIKYRNLVATPLVALGGYRQGGSKDLGGTFQFRTSFTLTYQFDDGSRFGIRLAHISNASLQERNPGENEVLLTYAIPF